VLVIGRKGEPEANFFTSILRRRKQSRGWRGSDQPGRGVLKTSFSKDREIRGVASST
jgi:hypothetical protein